MDDLKRKSELDPDYKDVSGNNFKRSRIEAEDGTEKNYERIVNIFQHEFQKEICSKREEVHEIQQQLLKAQKTLHLLKYVVVKSFYDSKELKINNTNEMPVLQSSNSTDLNVNNFGISSQSRIHPAIKKLLGKAPLMYEPYRTRKKYNKNITKRGENITIKEEDKDTEEINNDIFNENLCDIDKSCLNIKKEIDFLPVRNRNKSKYRIIVGNISKWMPSNSSQDNSTHKWMVYVRGPKENPDLSPIVKKVRFFLHPSYQPNDIVDIQESPFHLSRRGWGEFPLRVQIYFKNAKNKPVDIIHNIKLDRTYTGRQTMGKETVVDVWLHDKDFSEESEKTVKKPYEEQMFVKQEITENNLLLDKYMKSEERFEKEMKSSVCEVNNCDKISTFIDNCMQHLKELETIEKETTAIYEDNEDKLAVVSNNDILHDTYWVLNGSQQYDSYNNQVFLLNSIGVNEVILNDNKNIENELIGDDLENIKDIDGIYLEDHCYTTLKMPLDQQIKTSKYTVGKSNWTLDACYIDKDKHKIEVPLENLNTLSQIVYYLFKNLPLVTELAKDFNYTCLYPYVAATLEQYLSWNYAKQFCSEWYRAKHIKKFLSDHNLDGHQSWTVKSILMFGQAHGFSIKERYELFHKKTTEAGKSVPQRCASPVEVDTYTEAVGLKDLLNFKSYDHQNSVDDCNIDILNSRLETSKKKEIKNEPTELNLIDEDDEKLPCIYVRQTVQQIGINLEFEQIIEGVYQRTSEKIILKAAMCFAEELIRKALANNIIEKRIKNSEKPIDKFDIFKVLSEREEFSIFLNAGLGKNMLS